ncbi:MAG TPA: 1-acyl-sn-glycerol-3-phosphate acyltransferase [Bacteroidales bacterium]|nr:1-acyl-sn-glycerol-3-phosphate acyltransferase [Bacteroidales bacterium]
MSRKKSIDEWALDYWLLQQYAKLCYRIYYRKVEIKNLDRIPLNKAVLLAPNHQNALMDALVFVLNTSMQIVFLARADLFKTKRMSKFMHFLNIMPVYRIRDGFENVKKNDEVFARTTEVLNNRNNPLIIFPEGNHGEYRRLRPLVKGLFRVAFQAQEPNGTTPAVVILPVGIDYKHYWNFRTTIFVNIGEPIQVSEYYTEYTENPANAINRLKDDYAAELSKLMIDIQTTEYYDLYMHLREMYNERMKKELGITEKSLDAAFRSDKVMIDILNKELSENPENIIKLNNLVIPYQAEVKNQKLRDWVIKKGGFSIPRHLLSLVLYLAGLPVFLFGFVHNILPFGLTASRVKNIKDTQFHSSFKFVVSMIVFPVWYLIIGGVLALTHLPILIILFYIILLPLTGLLAFTYYIGFRKWLGCLRFLSGKNSVKVKKLVSDRSAIISMMNDIVRKHYSNK